MRDSDKTKQTILKCAKQMILDDKEDFSMRNIAKNCGITQGTIYVHFKDKGELLAHIIMDDWHKSLEKMDKLVNKCDSFSNGLYGLGKIIKDFSKPYYKVWNTYKNANSYKDSKQIRHKQLINQINKYVDILLNRFSKENLEITSLLSENILACSDDLVDIKQLKNLGKAIIKE